MEKYLLGIDLGGTTIKFGLIDTNGTILTQWSVPTNVSNNGESIVPDMIASIEAVLEQSKLSAANLIGAGMGCPGTVDRINGTVHHAFNLGWEAPQMVKQRFQEALGIPLFLENDANVAALGEKWRGSGNDAANLVFITLGTGVGGGVIIDHQIVAGVGGSGGEIGHFPIACQHRLTCTCGNTNCLETLASATGIVHLAEMYRQGTTTTLNQYENLTCEIVFQEAQLGDELAIGIIEEVAEYLGVTCSMIANLLNPEAIIIGGGVSAAKAFLLNKIAAYYQQTVFPSVRSSTKLKLATLGNEAGILGAAYLAKEGITHV